MLFFFHMLFYNETTSRSIENTALRIVQNALPIFLYIFLREVDPDCKNAVNMYFPFDIIKKSNVPTNNN